MAGQDTVVLGKVLPGFGPAVHATPGSGHRAGARRRAASLTSLHLAHPPRIATRLQVSYLLAAPATATRIQATAVAFLRAGGVLATAATAVVGIFKDDAMGWPPLRGQVTRLATVAGAVFTGAAAGGLLVERARLWAPVLPVRVTLLVCVVGHVVLRSAPPGAPSDALRR